MTTYVVVQKNTFDIENEVFFAYSLQEAIGKAARLTAEYPGTEWLIASVLE